MLAIETTRVPSTMEKAGLVVLQAELSKELGGSLSVFGIFGYDNFNSVDSYCGGFKTVTANIKHVQGYYSWSDTCSVVGVGATITTSLRPFGASFSATNYKRLEFKN